MRTVTLLGMARGRFKCPNRQSGLDVSLEAALNRRAARTLSKESKKKERQRQLKPMSELAERQQRERRRAARIQLLDVASTVAEGEAKQELAAGIRCSSEGS